MGESREGEPGAAPERTHTGRPLAAALAALLIPGLGHLVAGRRRRAAIFLVPTLAVAAVGGAWFLAAGPYGVAAALLSPAALTTLAVGNIALAVWRLAAAADAVRGTGPGRVAIIGSALLAVVLVGVPHAFAATPTPDPTAPPPEPTPTP